MTTTLEITKNKIANQLDLASTKSKEYMRNYPQAIISRPLTSLREAETAQYHANMVATVNLIDDMIDIITGANNAITERELIETVMTELHNMRNNAFNKLESTKSTFDIAHIKAIDEVMRHFRLIPK